jgi:CheY-like chemotaxis protein
VQTDESQKLLLLIEDNEVTATILRQVIAEQTPHRVIHATDAETAWQSLQHVKPNLILLDYRLPEMDGLELYDHLSASKELHEIPVLMMSVSLPTYEIVRRGIPCLGKPFEVEVFLQMIGRLLGS